MNFFETLHFVRPWWFVALLPLFALLWLLTRRRFLDQSWEMVCDAHLLSFMLLGRMLDVSRRGFLYLTGLAGVLAITALAGPAWERLPQPVLRDESALVVVLDLSLSMDAVDVQPSRLVSARFKVSDLLARGDHGQTGLVIYAHDAFTVVPITNDIAALELYLQALDTALMPRQGSRADLGLLEAGSLLQKINAPTGDVLLVTDYVDARAVEQARQLNAKSYRVSVLGIGTESGGPVSLSSGEFLSHKGEVVMPRLTETRLSVLARTGGGTYVRFDPFSSRDIETLSGWLDANAVAVEERKESEASTDVWREQGPWLILLLLPIAALGFRRGLLVMTACAILIQPHWAYAAGWTDLWLRPDQQAVRALERGNPEQAAELFENKQWKAAAQHRDGDFSAAAETLDTLDDAASRYNKGNALVGAGRLQEAVAAYQQALKMDPEMEDALHNMGLVREALEQMQMRQQSGENGEQGEDQQMQAQQDGEQPDQRQGDETQQDRSGEQRDELADKDAGEEQNPASQQEQDGEEGGADDAESSLETMTEKDQAIEQWLRGVPDNPGRLLKRKLRHLVRDKKNPPAEGDKPW